MGVFEMAKFAEGTRAVAESLAEANNTYSIIGRWRYKQRLLKNSI